MAEEQASKAVTIAATSLSVPGRFVIDVRQNHFVADASVARGGRNEAPVATELFVASLATCALAVITDTASKRGLRSAGYHVEVAATQDPDDATRFSAVEFGFRLADVDQDAAEALVKEFTDVCPIYNTVARTTPVTIAVSVK